MITPIRDRGRYESRRDNLSATQPLRHNGGHARPGGARPCRGATAMRAQQAGAATAPRAAAAEPTSVAARRSFVPHRPRTSRAGHNGCARDGRCAGGMFCARPPGERAALLCTTPRSCVRRRRSCARRPRPCARRAPARAWGWEPVRVGARVAVEPAGSSPRPRSRPVELSLSAAHSAPSRAPSVRAAPPVHVARRSQRVRRGCPARAKGLLRARAATR